MLSGPCSSSRPDAQRIVPTRCRTRCESLGMSPAHPLSPESSLAHERRSPAGRCCASSTRAWSPQTHAASSKSTTIPFTPFSTMSLASPTGVVMQQRPGAHCLEQGHRSPFDSRCDPVEVEHAKHVRHSCDIPHERNPDALHARGLKIRDHVVPAGTDDQQREVGKIPREKPGGRNKDVGPFAIVLVAALFCKKADDYRV